MVHKFKYLNVRMTKSDRDLVDKAAARSQQAPSTWGRAMMVMMAIWQTEGEVKLSPEHAIFLRTLRTMGMNPVKKSGKSAA